MVVLSTSITLPEASADRICQFMLHCDDERYRHWWPGAHFRFHTLKYRPGNIGNLVYYDELVGARRLRFQAVITEYVPGRRIVWQMKRWVRLPAWLSIDLQETPEGLRLTHELSAGFRRVGRFLDPLLRLYLSPEFEWDLSQHARVEFEKLASQLADVPD